MLRCSNLRQVKGAKVILLPTLNEEAGIADVVKECKRLFPKESMLVVDGHSKDNTIGIARQLGCKVMVQKGRGKGNAVIEALATMGSKETVMLIDADGSYDVSDFQQLLKHYTGKEIVIGNRFALREKGAFTGTNSFGNKALNAAASILFAHGLKDMLSGIRIFNVGVAKSLGLTAQNFEIEAEMTLKALKRGIPVVEIPCHYYPRQGETKLSPIKDGSKIFSRIWKERF